MASENLILRLVHIRHVYETAAGAEVNCVLRDVDLELVAGESLAIVGPSGCGKSTLLNLIGTLERPTAGEVFIGGSDVSKLSEKELAAVRNRELGFVFQAHHLLPQCTVLENVLVPTLAAGNSSKPADSMERARRLLHRVGLDHRLDHLPGQLSGGERQRAAVVRALINQPRLRLADEPTGALDQASAEGLAQLLLELNREEKVTLILVTHARELAMRMQRVVELREGVLHILQ